MVRVEVVDAFLSESGEGGNPAGVVVEAADLSSEAMQEIALKVGASETAFVLPSTRSDLRLRFFTPRSEIPLCGHATLGAFHVLAASGKFGLDDGIRRLTCETGAGHLAVDVHVEDGSPQRVVLTQSKPEVVVPRLMLSEVAPHLGVERARIERTGAPIQIVSTGIRHVMVPVDSRETLASLAPRESLGPFLESKKVQTLHAWVVTQTRPQIRVAQRAFAPHLGIPEDPATGTATGAMAAYLLFNHLVPGSPPVTTIRAEQGAETGRPCFLVADVHVDPVMGGVRPTKVKVGGRCRAARTITL